jgi:hypothetical protein
MRVICAPLIIAALFGVSSAGGDDAKVQKKTKRDPKALELVKQAADLCKNAKTLHVEVDVETNVKNGDEKQDMHFRCFYDLERPDHFALRTRPVKDKEGGLDCVSDGKTLIVHSLRLKQFTESPAPKSLADFGDRLSRFGRSATGFFYPNLLTDDPNESLVEDLISCSYAGKEKVGDVEAHHVKAVHPEIKWELWVAATGKPLVLKTATLVAVDEIRVAGTETYKNWKVDEPLDKAAFAITAPTNATKVDTLGAPKQSK